MANESEQETDGQNLSEQLALVTPKPLSHTPASLREDCLAKVFLSYAREDVTAAKQLAECIGRAGHQVWWDRQIQGGSRFAT